MMSRLRRHQIANAILLGTALALVVLVLATNSRLTTSEADARSQNLLQLYREEDITRVRFERKEDGFTMVRTSLDDAGSASWNLTEPVKETAEPFGVQKILGTLEFASAIRRIKPEEINRKAFGLDDPALIVHVDMGEVKYRLRMGAEAASPEGARYLEIAGEGGAPGQGVALISKSLVAELGTKTDELRERYVMPYLSSALERMTIEGEGGSKKLRRGDWEDGWRFDGMLGDARAGRAVLDRILTQFARTRAEEFLDGAVAEKAMAAGPRVQVTLFPSNPKSPRGIVVVGGRCPANDAEVVAQRLEPDRLAACVPKSVLAGLTTAAESLVDRSLFWMRPDEVETFEVSQGAKKLVLDRKEAGFLMRAPREATVEPEAGSMRLDALLRANGTVVASPDRARLGLEPASGRALVKSAAAEDSRVREEVVRLGTPQPDGKIYVERGHDGIVLELDRDAARAVVPDGVLLKTRQLIDVPIVDVTEVEVTGVTRQLIARSPTGAFTYVTPSGFDVDGALALELTDTLRSLAVERWVAETDDGTFGLDASTLGARLQAKKEDKTTNYVVKFGKPAGTGYYAKIDSDPGVFVLPRRVYETLTTLAFDRSVFLVDPSITARITVETAQRTVVLEKQGDDFVESNPGTTPLSPESIRRIVDTLTSLRAEAALYVGPPRPESGMDRPILTVRVEREAAHAEKPPRVIWRAGAGDSWRGISIHYARVDGVNATYAVARSGIRAVVDSL